MWFWIGFEPLEIQPLADLGLEGWNWLCQSNHIKDSVWLDPGFEISQDLITYPLDVYVPVPVHTKSMYPIFYAISSPMHKLPVCPQTGEMHHGPWAPRGSSGIGKMTPQDHSRLCCGCQVVEREQVGNERCGPRRKPCCRYRRDDRLRPSRGEPLLQYKQWGCQRGQQCRLSCGRLDQDEEWIQIF